MLAKVAGAEGGSRTQRVSATAPRPTSNADTAAFTDGVRYHAPGLGAGGVKLTVVCGGSVSTNDVQAKSTGVTISDQPLNVPVSIAKLSATCTVQVPFVRVPLCRLK